MRRRSTPGCGAARVLGLTPADLHLDVATPYLRVRRTLLQDGTTDEPKTNAAKRRVPLPTAASVSVSVTRTVTWYAPLFAYACDRLKLLSAPSASGWSPEPSP